MYHFTVVPTIDPYIDLIAQKLVFKTLNDIKFFSEATCIKLLTNEEQIQRICSIV